MIRVAQEAGTGAIIEEMLPMLLSPVTLEAKPAAISHTRRMMEGTPVNEDAGHLAPVENPRDFNENLRGFLASLGD